jgi:hypothetical protein
LGNKLDLNVDRKVRSPLLVVLAASVTGNARDEFDQSSCSPKDRYLVLAPNSGSKGDNSEGTSLQFLQACYLLCTSLAQQQRAQSVISGIMGRANAIARSGQTTLVTAMRVTTTVDT